MPKHTKHWRNRRARAAAALGARNKGYYTLLMDDGTLRVCRGHRLVFSREAENLIGILHKH